MSFVLWGSVFNILGAHTNLLKEKFLCGQLVDEDSRVLVHHGEFAARETQIQTADGFRMPNQLDGKAIIDEDLDNRAVLEPHKETFAT